MKKAIKTIFLLILLLIVVSLPKTYAQKTVKADKAFESVLNKIINDYPNDFSNLKGDSIGKDFIDKAWKSRENLTGHEDAWLDGDTLMGPQITWKTTIIQSADSTDVINKYREISGMIDEVRFDCGMLTKKESSDNFLYETRKIVWSYPGKDNKFEGMDLCLIMNYPISLPGEYGLTLKIQKFLAGSDETVKTMPLPPGQEKTDKVKEENKTEQTSGNSLFGDNLPDLCDALAALTKESVTKFAGISGKDLEPSVHFDNKRKESTYKIKDASSCYIEAVTSANLKWYAEFGSFNSLSEAESKIKALQSGFISCMPKLEFNKVNELSPFEYSYYFKESIDGGLRLYNGKLGIYSYKDKYIPFLCLPENASYITFSTISNEANTSALAQGLGRLLTESLIEFKNIIGTKRTIDKKDLFSMKFHYPTSFCLPGASECEIEESGMLADKGHKSYYAKNINAADADKQIEKLTKDVSDALGKNYVWENTTNGTRFTESSKVGIKNSPVIEVEKDQHGEMADILIQVIIHFKF